MRIQVENQKNCVYCGKCFPVCPVGALSYDGDNCIVDAAKCVGCGACIKVCPCDVYCDADAPKPEKHPETRRIETELLVIGGGASGLAAALAAAQEGVRVTLLEKMKKPGGCGQFALDLLMFNSRLQKQIDPRDLTDDLVRAGMNTTRGELNPKLLRNAFGALAGFFDDFCLWGKPEENFRVATKMSDWYYHRPDDSGSPDPRVDNPMLCTTTREAAGSFLMRKSVARCRELGVEILTEHAAREFIMENGRPVGVLAKEPGGITEIRFKAVIAAAGNLLNCPELINRCLPDYADARRRPSAHAFPGDTGDCVLMAERAGVPVDYDNICSALLGAYGTTLDRRLTPQFNRAETLKLNLNGERWINETNTGEDCVFPLAKQPECTTWQIMDSHIAKMEAMEAPPLVKDPMEGRNMFMTISGPDGQPHPMAVVKKTAPYHFPIMGMNKMTGDEVAAALEKLAAMKGGTVARGDTIEELAVNMGLDPQKVKGSVERYNGFCEKGHDDDFYKAPSHLIPIKEAPFYALNLNLVSDGVFGGFFINENTEVLDAGNKPIPGLYAAGDNTSSRYVSMTYQKKEFMNDFPWALSSGRLAGLAAASFIKG